MGLQGHFTSPTPAPAAQPAATTEAPAQAKTENVSREKTAAPTKSTKTDTTAKQAEAIVEKVEKIDAAPDQLFDVVINGKQIQATKDQLIRMAQKGEAADQKFDQASKMSKQANDILEFFKKDPARAMKELGHDVRSMAEQFLADEIRKEMMTPEQKDAMELRRENEEMKKRLKEADDKAQEERLNLEKAKYVKKYDEELTAAIEGAGLLKDPSIVKNVARIMHDYLEKGFEVSAVDAVKEFQESVLAQASNLIRLVGPERATKMLGDDFMNAIRKEDLKKIKNPLTPSGDNGNFGTRAVPAREKEEKISIEEWKRRNRERINA